jgi:4-amino-4-deoxy-L-arabinose transferase-like glycosyltransferase
MPERAVLRRVVVLVILAAGGLYLLGNGRVSLWDRDEPRYAQTSRQMLDSGDWVVPRLYDKVRTAKPVFIYWCQAAAMRVLGDNAFAARLPSAVAMTLTLCLLAVVVWRHVDPERAGWTVFVLAFSVLVVMCAKMSTTDAVLLLWITIAQLGLYACWQGRATWAVVIAMALAVGLAGLTKGPVVLGVIGMTLVALAVFRAIDRRRANRAPDEGDTRPSFSRRARPARLPIALLKLAVGITLAAAVAAPWLYLVHARESSFLGTTVSHDVFGRIARPLEGHRGPPGYYLLVIFAIFLPWSLLLPMAVVNGWKNRSNPAVRFALAAALGPWLMFEVVQTKLPHYLLPIFPALAFLTADAIVRAREAGAACDLRRRGFVRAAGVWTLIIALLAFAPWAAATKFRPLPWITMALLTTVGLAYAGLVFGFFRRRRPIQGLLAMGFGFAAVMALLFGLYLPRADFLRVSARTADILTRQGATGPGAAFMLDYKEPSLAFYQGGTIRENPAMSLSDALLDAAPPWLVITDHVWQKSPEDVRDRVEVVGTVRGLAYADRGRVVEVMVVRKRVGEPEVARNNPAGGASNP